MELYSKNFYPSCAYDWGRIYVKHLKYTWSHEFISVGVIYLIDWKNIPNVFDSHNLPIPNLFDSHNLPKREIWGKKNVQCNNNRMATEWDMKLCNYLFEIEVFKPWISVVCTILEKIYVKYGQYRCIIISYQY